MLPVLSEINSTSIWISSPYMECWIVKHISLKSNFMSIGALCQFLLYEHGSMASKNPPLERNSLEPPSNISSKFPFNWDGNPMSNILQGTWTIYTRDILVVYGWYTGGIRVVYGWYTVVYGGIRKYTEVYGN